MHIGLVLSLLPRLRHCAVPNITRYTVYGMYESTILQPFACLVVHPLAQQLNRGLSKVLLPLWHIQVVHKDDILLASWRAKDALQSSAL